VFRLESVNIRLEKVSATIVGQSKESVTELIYHGGESHFVDLARETIITDHHRRTRIHDMVAVVRLGPVHATTLKSLIALFSSLHL